MMHEARLKAQRDQWAIEYAMKEDSWNEGWSKGQQRGIEQGIAIGETNGGLQRSRQNILDLLEDLGDVPEDIHCRICTEADEETLRKWLKLSAKAGSMEDFRMRMD